MPYFSTFAGLQNTNVTRVTVNLYHHVSAVQQPPAAKRHAAMRMAPAHLLDKALLQRLELSLAAAFLNLHNSRVLPAHVICMWHNTRHM
jgi:hypothetical protein